jgi:hypothetical protein
MRRPTLSVSPASCSTTLSRRASVRRITHGPFSEEEFGRWLEQIRTRWGDRDFAAADLLAFAPSIADDPEMQE